MTAILLEIPTWGAARPTPLYSTVMPTEQLFPQSDCAVSTQDAPQLGDELLHPLQDSLVLAGQGEGDRVRLDPSLHCADASDFMLDTDPAI